MAACYCLKEFGHAVDRSGKDVSRLTFISYDAHPHWNPGAIELDWNWQAWARENESAFGKLGGAATRLNDDYVYADTEESKGEASRRKQDDLWADRQAPASLVCAAVAALDETVVCEYGDWLSIGMALHWWGQHTGQAHRAHRLFHEASKKCPQKYRPSQVDIKWKSFDVSRRCLDDNCVTVGTLFHYALECGYEFPKRPKNLGRSLGRTRVPKGVAVGGRTYP